jgi:transposase
MNTVHDLGIDVSKKTLSCHLRIPEGNDKKRTFKNDITGMAELVEWLGSEILLCRVLIEPTSRYHRRICEVLSNLGGDVRLIDPKQMHYLAKGLGNTSKSDDLDAKALAQASSIIDMPQRPLKTAQEQELMDLSRVIVKTKQVVAGQKKSLEGLDEKSQAYIAIMLNIQSLELVLRQHEKAWMKLMRKNEEAKRRYELAISVPHIGKETARILASELPKNLMEASTDQICAYAGVVPYMIQSGTCLSISTIGCQGNAHIRTGLYMPTLSSLSHSPENKEIYDKLRAKGRFHNQAMVAVIHHNLRVAVSVIKRDTPWTPKPPTKEKKKPLQCGSRS